MFMAAPFGKSGVVTFLAPMQDITDADFMQIVATRGAPDYFIAGTTVGIVTAAKEASAAIAAHNLVLLDGGKVKPLAAVDSSNALNVTGLYGIAAEDAASGEDAVVYLTGEFFAEGLALPDGVTAADIDVALRNIGIFLK